jgi:hypothetical protein
VTPGHPDGLASFGLCLESLDFPSMSWGECGDLQHGRNSSQITVPLGNKMLLDVIRRPNNDWHLSLGYYPVV